MKRHDPRRTVLAALATGGGLALVGASLADDTDDRPKSDMRSRSRHEVDPVRATSNTRRPVPRKIWGQLPEGGIAGGPPPNDDCANSMALSVGITPFDTTGASTDGPPHAACLFFGDAQVNQDIWYDYIATTDGYMTFSLCGSTYDTKLAVYDGCVCPVGDANLLACNDDFCSLQSVLPLILIKGNCYKIRVGGFTTAAGAGQLSAFPLLLPTGSLPES